MVSQVAPVVLESPSEQSSVASAAGSGVPLSAPRPPAPPSRMPVGPDGQLAALQAQLHWCDQALQRAIRDTAQAMRSEQLSDAERWGEVRALRTIAWKVVREILPLLNRIPVTLHGTAAHSDCQRVGHQLRRRAESALANNANYTVDLLNAGSLQGRAW